MPQKRDPKTNPKAFLGKRLRLGRIAAGFNSQEALAARLGFDRSVVAKTETGDRPPTPDVLAAWCEACGLDVDLFADLAELARTGDGPVPTWFEDYLEAEQEAHTLRIWSLVLVPGLLQTASYAHALFVAAGVDSDTADEMASARLERQAILDRPDPPHVVVMLDESVLRRLIGTPQVMADVLAHMAEVSDRPNVSVQILPAETGANAGLSGAFDIASADGTPDVLRMDGVEDVTTENRSLVRKAAIIFDRVRADALPRAASRARVLEAAEQWKTR